MIVEKDIPGGLVSEDENSQSKLSRHVSACHREKPGDKFGFSERAIDLRGASDIGSDEHSLRQSKMGNLGSQELTLSYLCDNSKLEFSEKDTLGRSLPGSLEKDSCKGKEVLNSENFIQDDGWVERDFLNLNETRGNSSKHEVVGEVDGENREKPKLETLNLSLALPDISLSLTASNALQNEDPPIRSRPTRSVQSLAPSNTNTLTTCSNDFTAASRSYSYSHPFSHNPSCSLAHNSTENYDYSVGRDDQIWNCGEGTNGSVHSRFKPLGDGVSLSNHGGGLYYLMQGNNPLKKDSFNNHNITTISDNHSFLPSELPARPRDEMHSGDSRGKGFENLKELDIIDGGRARKLIRPERILREIVWEPIPIMAQILQELTDETLASTKDYLQNLIDAPEKRGELSVLQQQLKRRSDLNKEILSKCHKDQIGILIAIRMGLKSFVSGKFHSSIPELVDIFLYLKCRNCRSIVPVDDCDCKICSANEGFCSSCMCPVCLNFDCANNTCSWVGCDVCSHWCHASCGIRRNLIKPGQSLKGPSGTTEMQFHCIACGHASEMFGFVKDVFMCCAKDWGLETLMKELDCVSKIFEGSEDNKGKELYVNAVKMLSSLEKKMISSRDACNFIIQFFNYAEGKSEFLPSGISSKDVVEAQTSLKDVSPYPQCNSLPSTYAAQKLSSSSMLRDLLSSDHHPNNFKSSIMNEMNIKDGVQYRTLSKEEGLDSLESIVRIKRAEAHMFQSKADDARREAEGLQRIIIAKTEKLEEEYAGKLAKLRMHESEEMCRKKLKELKDLEISYFDYYNMKMRMQTEIAGLLQRIESTRRQLV